MAAEMTAVTISALLLGTYFVLLELTLRKRPLHTMRGIMRAARRSWVEGMLGKGDDWSRWWRTDKGAEDVTYTQFMGKDNVPFHTLTFPATILGGLDSVVGSAFGGVVIGITENLVGGYLSPGLKEVAGFVIIAGAPHINLGIIFGGVCMAVQGIEWRGEA